ncbi:hypothetical protein HK414_23445 [Ramlibacter terrae]|uniref:Uncharacterized protein n=1 Tax=Ramlibacter terrae TaxID=2732511 RepID=A0ABX6P6X1_9BURK|nr:hypothetical protein HK414_23445 [Ramlibacter terrae]
MYGGGAPHVGFMPFSHRQWWDGGKTVDMASRPLRVDNADVPPVTESNSALVSMTGYAIEVEGDCAFFVGKAGLWTRG